jgi:hypothetical protein
MKHSNSPSSHFVSYKVTINFNIFSVYILDRIGAKKNSTNIITENQKSYKKTIAELRK